MLEYKIANRSPKRWLDRKFFANANYYRRTLSASKRLPQQQHGYFCQDCESQQQRSLLHVQCTKKYPPDLVPTMTTTTHNYRCTWTLED